MSSHGSRRLHVFGRGRWLAALVALFAVLLGTATPVAAASVPVTAGPTVANAPGGPVKASLVGFQPGNIISDAVFTDKSTMTEAQIQAFFDSKVKTCRGGSDQWGPIICLKDFRTDSVTRPADAYCKGYTGAPNESAARIIHRVSQSCGINPQVLIVMLQKEQSLVTHTWPSAPRYDAALGQGCPDGGIPCNPKYVGFFHQIYGAARQMQVYMEGKYFTWYAPGKTWNILWRPPVFENGAWVDTCGRGAVYVANKATSALYYYTPYQPNAAALRAGYGKGDSCSSYGNRNFYNYFTDWFGSTQTPAVPAPVTPPPAPAPTLGDVDSGQFVLATDSSGVAWAYPFAKGRWGARVAVAGDLGNVAGVDVVGDLDGDGHRDIVAVDSSRRAWLLKGSGKASFSKPQALAVDWSGSVLRTSAGDFDGDGVPDMFATDRSGGLWLWRGDDRGSFSRPAKVGTGWQGMTALSGGADMNRDGFADLLARSADGSLFLYSGDGRGGWANAQQVGKGWQGMTALFSARDFSGDGGADVLARATDGALWAYPTTAEGGLGRGQKVGSGWHGMTALAGSGAPAAEPRALRAGAGDIDGDRAADVVALSSNGVLRVYQGDDEGGWRGNFTIATGWGAKDQVLPIGDFTGDGHRDLGRIDSSGVFTLLRGAGGKTMASPVRIGTGWGGMTLLIAGVDFNGDRNPDVLARTSGNDLLLYPGNGRGGWGPSSVVGRGWGSVRDAFYAGDFDGDGKGDVITRMTDGSLRLYPTDGVGAWKTSSQVGSGWGGFTALAAPGDFDGDGEPDVLGRTAQGDLLLYSGDGQSGWTGSRTVGRGWGEMLAIR